MESHLLLKTDNPTPPVYFHVPDIGRRGAVVRSFIQEIPNNHYITELSKSDQAIAVVVSDSFDELLGNSESHSSCNRFLRIPCLFLAKHTSPGSGRGIDKIRSELDSARKISGIWPVIIVSEEKHKHRYEELLPAFAAIGRIGQDIQELNRTLGMLSMYRKIMSSIIDDSRKGSSLRRLVAGNLGLSLLRSCREEVHKISKLQESIDSAWAETIYLSGLWERECLRGKVPKTFRESVNDSRFHLLDWFYGDSLKLYQSIAEAYAERFDPGEPGDSGKMISHSVVFNSLSMNACSPFGYSARGLRSFLKADRGCKSFMFADDSLLMNGEPDYACNEADGSCTPESINEHTGFFSPVDGELIWVGQSSVLIHVTSSDMKGCTLWVCSEPSSEPCSHLVVGANISRKQRLFHRTSNRCSVESDKDSSHWISILRSYKISSSISSSVTCAVMGDTLNTYPWSQMSSSRLTSIGLDDEAKGKWLGTPIVFNGAAQFAPNMEVLRRFREEAKQPTLDLNRRRIHKMLINDICKMQRALGNLANLPGESDMTNTISEEVFDNTLSVQRNFIFIYDDIIESKTKRLSKLEAKAVSNELQNLKLKLEFAREKPGKAFDRNNFPTSCLFLKEAMSNLDKIVQFIYNEAYSLTDFISGVNHSLSKTDQRYPKAPVEYTKRYWYNRIGRFPEDCEDWRKRGKRNRWTTEKLNEIIKELSEATENWQVIPEINNTLKHTKAIANQTKSSLENRLNHAESKFAEYAKSIDSLRKKEKELLVITKEFGTLLDVCKDSKKLWGHSDAR